MKKRGLFVLLIVISLISLISIASSFDLFDNGSKNILKVTGEHPFFVNNSWVKASELNVGDELLTVDGKIARIVGIKDVDENVLVYNLGAEKYNDFIVGEGVIVHNSNRIVPDITESYYEVFVYNWGKQSRDLVPGFSEDGMLEIIIVDFENVRPGLKSAIETRFSRSFDSITSTSSFDELNSAAVSFSKRMYDDLPFLGYRTIETMRIETLDQKILFYNYLKLSQDGTPTLSELINSKMLDCTGENLLIRESLGGSNSGWKIFHGIDNVGRERAHTFLAKEFDIDGNSYMVIIDPTEYKLYSGSMNTGINPDYIRPYAMVIPKQDFERRGFVQVSLR